MRPQLPGVGRIPASPSFLVDVIVNAVKGYTANFQLTTPMKDQNERYVIGPPTVWSSSIAGYMAGFSPETVPPNFPGIVVQRQRHRINAHEACAHVKLLVGIFHPDLDKQGYQTLWNVMDQIANGFWFDEIVGDVFSLDFKETTHMEIYEPEHLDWHPFYFGYIDQVFMVLKPQDKYFDNVHTVDAPQGNRDFALPILPPDV